MSRKFQNGQAVVISSPSSANTRYSGYHGTVHSYNNTYAEPYLLDNGLRVTVREISAIQVPSAEDMDISLETVELNKVSRKSIDRFDLNMLMFEKMEPSVFDTAKVVFIPNDATSQTYMTSSTARYVSNNRDEMEKYVGQTGTVCGISAKEFLRIQFKNGNEQWFPNAAVQLISRSVELFKFMGSSEREVVLYNGGVYIDNHMFTFETFEKLYSTIKEHLKQHKTGSERNVEIDNDYNGVLRDTYIQVGCQSFPYTNIRRLMAAIRLAKSL